MYQRLLLCTVLVSLSACASPRLQPTWDAADAPRISGGEWTLVPELSDEFNGTEFDETKWHRQPRYNGWGWIGRPPGLFLEESVQVRDGALRVSVGRLPEPRYIEGDTFLYRGGIVRSLQPGRVGYYYETRMKANATEMSSTFWLMSRPDCERKQELDIQECIGAVTELTYPFAKKWDAIYHSNAIHRRTECNPEPTQIQGAVATLTKNHERYYVYGCWWKSPRELRFYLDGKYMYTVEPSIDFDLPKWLHMAIETYDWNPVPADGGRVSSATEEERTTSYDWVRVWKVKQ